MKTTTEALQKAIEDSPSYFRALTQTLEVAKEAMEIAMSRSCLRSN